MLYLQKQQEKEINMKRTGLILMCAIVVMCLSAGCRNARTAPAPAPEEETAPVDNFFTTIESYLTELGGDYAPGEFTIPYFSYTLVDDSNPDDIQVLGNFYVFNYKRTGDTLETVSGGNHPGKFHLKKETDGQYSVTGFDAVGDGSQSLPTVRKIFGDRSEEFLEAQSNDSLNEHARARAIADYVRAHDIPVKYYKDFGWPAVEIPSAE